MTDYEGDFPYAPGRTCSDCDKALSRHNPGPLCNHHNPPERVEDIVLREVLRHYIEFEALAQDEELGNQYINGYTLTYGAISVSFLDLQNALKNLSKRKKEAVHYNVILDWKQKDVAAKMGITTVSVGQYVRASFQQISEQIFGKKENSGDTEKRN